MSHCLIIRYFKRQICRREKSEGVIETQTHKIITLDQGENKIHVCYKDTILIFDTFVLQIVSWYYKLFNIKGDFISTLLFKKNMFSNTRIKFEIALYIPNISNIRNS